MAIEVTVGSTRTPSSFWHLALIGAVAHAIFTALFWVGPLMYVGLGLGFKDRAKWTWLDTALAEWALPLANLLTSPGRSLTYNGLGGLLLPSVLTSSVWGVGIAFLICVVRRLQQRPRALQP